MPFPVWSFSLGVALVVAPGLSVAQLASPGDLPRKLNQGSPCVTAAAEYHVVNPWVLKAILKIESDFKEKAVNRNANGTIDVGMAQINSIHFAKLARYGIAPTELLDGCKATYVAAWHLANQLRMHGNTWFGVASYHSVSTCQNTRYAGLLWNALTGWGVVAGPRVGVSSLRDCGYIAPTQRGSDRLTGRTTSTTSALAFDAN